MSSDTVVVTGGAGFIGSHLVEKLLEVGYRVMVIDDFSAGSMSNLSNASEFGSQLEVVRQDIAEPGLAKVMEQAGPRYVFHLAAQSDVRRSMADPFHDAKVNVLGSVNVIESSRKLGVERVIYAASGGTLYGEPESSELPVTEDVKYQPLSNYGVTKKVVLDYLFSYREAYGLDYVALALANVYGPRQDPHGESGVVSIFAGNLAAGRTCAIYGDGHQTRDFVFVSDVADAFVASMTKGSGEVFNISTSIETSVNSLYWEMAGQHKLSLHPSYLPGRTGELMRSCLSNVKAGEILSWVPHVTLSDGLSQVIEWVNKNN